MSDTSTDTQDRDSERSGDRGDRGPRRGGPGGGRGRYRAYFRKKVCKFCTNRAHIDYLDPDALRRFVTDRGKILPGRVTGTCAKHQRLLGLAIKRARALALLPFVANR
jgi:small subunit ribosomal protein S18